MWGFVTVYAVGISWISLLLLNTLSGDENRLFLLSRPNLQEPSPLHYLLKEEIIIDINANVAFAKTELIKAEWELQKAGEWEWETGKTWWVSSQTWPSKQDCSLQ